MGRDVFSGKVAVVTGGASGIGAALGKALSRRGAVVVLGDRQADLAETVAAEIRADGGTAAAEEVDVRAAPSVANLVQRALTRTGRIDYFFNNAGISVGGEAHAYTAGDWDDVLDVNLRGVTNGTHAVYPIMVRQQAGHIVNTASVAGLLPLGGQLSYATSKHAIVGLSKALRVEAKRYGVRVSVLCPGIVRTAILTGGRYGRLNLPGLTEEAARRLTEQVRPMNADVFAEKAVRAIANNEAIVVIPRWWKALWYIDRLSPTLAMRLAEVAMDQMRVRIGGLASGSDGEVLRVTAGQGRGARGPRESETGS
jgi:NADP-dependent 3-hydroxy acid dehydrogenase YdfG